MKSTRIQRLSRYEARRIKKQNIARGAEVARERGWPTEDQGWLGAIGGLLDPFSLQRVEIYQ